MAERPTVVDLFCGAGGLSLGLERAGFQVVAAYDSWRPAIDTYRENLPHTAHCEAITPETELPDCDVIAGGPPCQGFSSAGMRRDSDGRNSLVGVFAQLVAKYRPLAFVFENVEGFLTGSSGRFLFDLLDPVIEAGYRVHLVKVNAANFGVPQHRKRVVAVGGRGWDPELPQPSHTAFGAPGAHLAARTLAPAPTVTDGLRGLPTTDDVADDDALDHRTWPLSEEFCRRVALLAPGQCMRDLPEHLWHESYRRRAFRRVMDGTPSERRGGAPAGLRRLHPDEPAKTVTGGAISELLHPSYNRPLTTRECARLQTFPDCFRFLGSRRERVQLIGNAVPPLLAARIGRTLYSAMLNGEPDTRPGELLSFVPTLSDGASPVLRTVIAEVEKRFRGASPALQSSFEWR